MAETSPGNRMPVVLLMARKIVILVVMVPEEISPSPDRFLTRVLQPTDTLDRDDS